MNFISELLKDGAIVSVGAMNQTMLVAQYQRSEEEKPSFSVHSDRGVEHLLLLLIAAVSGSEPLREEANRKFLYPLLSTNVPARELFFHNRIVCFLRVENEYFVQAYQTTVPSIRHPVTIYAKTGQGKTVEKALFNAIHTESFV